MKPKNNKIKAVIMAGGRGTRIRGITEDVPKPMIDICGKPLLERQIDWLITQDVYDITLVVGHLGNTIIDYFNNGEKFGVKIDYIIEDNPLGTAGALFYLDFADNAAVLLLNGDLVLDIDLKKMYEYHKEKKADITLLTHPNNHPYDSAIIETSENGRIINWMSKEDDRKDYKNRVNAGVHLIEPHALGFFKHMETPQKMDLDRDILKPNINNFIIQAYDTPEYVKDMGTLDRYRTVCEDFSKGFIFGKNLSKKQKAFFLDRDGTINKLNGFITSPDEIKLLDGAAEGIGIINRSGYLAILITNQPVIARGDCTLEDLRNIHNRLERLLGEKHAYLDDIFFCPHHPDKGFEGERAEYKIECSCRKPKAGLIFQAAEKYNIDLANSFMIGDSASDIAAGEAAGCKTGYISKDMKEKDLVHADVSCDNLKNIVEVILHDNN